MNQTESAATAGSAPTVGYPDPRCRFQHHVITFLGIVLFFALMDYVPDNAETQPGQGLLRNVKFFYRVLPITAVLPALILCDYCYCKLMGLTFLFRFPAIAITLYLFTSAVTSATSSMIIVGGWKTFEAFVCLYWAAIACAHADRNDLASPLTKLMPLFSGLVVYSLAGALLFPDTNFLRDTRAPIPILVCTIPTFAHNYLAFVAVYSFISLSANPAKKQSRPLSRYALLFCAATVILLTQTRAAWLAIFLAVATWGAVRVVSKPTTGNYSYRTVYFLLLSLFLFGSSAIGLIAFPDSASKLIARGQDISEFTQLSGRSGMWSIAASEIGKRPAFGSGISIAVRNVNRGSEYKSVLLDINKKWMEQTPNLHNSNLEILMNSGMLGGLPFVLLILLWLPWISLRELWQNTPESNLSGMIGLTLVVESMALSPLAQGSHAFVLLSLIVCFPKSSRKRAEDLTQSVIGDVAKMRNQRVREYSGLSN